MLVLLALLTPALAGDCEAGPTTPAQMDAHVDDALFAFATLDEQGVYDAADQASAVLGCMSAVLSTPNAAAYHRLVGIRAFMAGDADAALTAFQAARAIQPGYQLSGKIAPEGGRLHRLYEQAAETPDALTATFKAPKGTVAYVDGVEATAFSMEFPAVIQYASSDGQVLWTGYLQPGDRPPRDVPSAAVAEADEALPDDPADLLGDLDDLPEPGEMDEPEVAEIDEPEQVSDDLADLAAALDEGDEPEAIPTDVDLDERRAKPAREGGGGGLLVTGIIVGSVGLAAGTGAVLTRSSFDNEPTATKFHLTNGLYYGSIAGIGLGAGLIVTGALVNVDF